MFEYKSVKEYCVHPENGTFRTYGLAVYCGNRLLQYQPDVSVERDVIEKIVYLCNAEQVEPIHMLDVILNMI